MKINTKFNKKLLAVMSIATMVSTASLVPTNGFASNFALVEVQASSETSESDIESIKQAMLEATPITESQFDQIPEEAWLAYSERISNEGDDPSTVYDWALEDYSAVFEPAIAYYRNAMVDNYNLAENSLSAVISDRDLLWLEYTTWMEAGGQEDLQALADALVNEYGIKYAGESNEERVAQLKETMLSSTPVTSEQFDEIPGKAWITFSDRISEEGGDPSTAYNWAVEDYPDVFADTIAYIRGTLITDYNLNEDSLNTVSDIDLLWLEYSVWVEAGNQENFDRLSERLIDDHNVVVDEEETPDEDLEAIRQVMLDGTPLTTEQFDAIPAESWIAYSDRVNEGGGDPSTVYNWAVDDYPAVFEDTIAYIRGTLVTDYNVNEESLNTVSDIDLLWLEYSVWIESGNQEDFQRLTERLVEEHDVIVDEETPGNEDLERIRTVMLETTPITPDQFASIPGETWIAYTDQINEEGGDPSTAYNWALRDYPEVFQSTIDYIRSELVEKYNLEEASLNELVSNQELLWEEYSVWLQNGEENLEQLSNVLVQEYGVRRTSTSVPDDGENDPAPTLPNTGESRMGYVSYIAIAIVGLLGLSILVQDHFKNKSDA